MDFDEYYQRFWADEEEPFVARGLNDFLRTVSRRVYDNVGGPVASLHDLEQSASSWDSFLEAMMER